MVCAKSKKFRDKAVSLFLCFALVMASFVFVFPASHVIAASWDRAGYDLVWQDEFNGTTLDRTKWDPWWPDRTGHFIHPDVNGSGMDPDNVSVSNGKLILTIDDDGMTVGNKTVTYNGACVTSRYAANSYKYGYIEARVNFNSCGGAFWMLPDNGFINRGGDGTEVDVVECYRPYGNRGQFRTNFYWECYQKSDYMNVSAPDVWTGWHTYGIEWDADKMVFYYDGKPYWTKYGEGVPQGFEHFVFNVGGDTDLHFPQSFQVDYIRVYNKSGVSQESHPLAYYNNYVQNDGFETGSLANWGGYGSRDVVGNNAYEGSYCGRLASGAAFEQTLSGLQQGKLYEVTAYIKVDNPSENVYVGMKWFDDFVTAEPNQDVNRGTNSIVYVKKSFLLKMGVYNKNATIYAWKPAGGTGYAYVDKIEVKRVPNLCFQNPAYASSSLSDTYDPTRAIDGYSDSGATRWQSNGWSGSPQYLTVDLRQSYTIGRYVVRHAGGYESWGTQSINTRDFQFMVSNDGTSWTTVDTVTGNTANITDRIVNTSGRYVRLYITNPQTETTDIKARIYEFEVYPSSVDGASQKPDNPTPSWLAAPSTASEIAVNGGFESGNLSGWSSYGTCSLVSPGVQYFNGGNYQVQISAGSAVEQIITGLLPNTTYVLSGVLQSSTASGKIYLGVKFFGGNSSQDQRYIIQDTGWYEASEVIFTTGPSTTSATIYAWVPADGVGGYADNISMKKYEYTISLNNTSTGTDINQFEFTGGWGTASSEAGTYFGDHRFSNTTGNYCQIKFVGNKINLYGVKDNNSGIASISIDDGVETDVDMYSSARQRQVLLYSGTNLSYGQHTLKVRVKGTKNANSSNYFVDVDRADIVSDRVTVNDSVSASSSECNKFYYSGTWNTITGETGALNNEYHWSNLTNNYYEVAFSGNCIKLYGLTDINGGIAAVSIDGGTETDVDFYSSTRQKQMLLYTSPMITSGQHTLKVRVKGTKNAGSSGYYISADRVDIY